MMSSLRSARTPSVDMSRCVPVALRTPSSKRSFLDAVARTRSTHPDVEVLRGRVVAALREHGFVARAS